MPSVRFILELKPGSVRRAYAAVLPAPSPQRTAVARLFGTDGRGALGSAPGPRVKGARHMDQTRRNPHGIASDINILFTLR